MYRVGGPSWNLYIKKIPKRQLQQLIEKMQNPQYNSCIQMPTTYPINQLVYQLDHTS